MKLTLKAFMALGLLAPMGSIIADDCNTCTTGSSSACDSSSTGSSSVGVTCKPSLLPFSQGENRARDYANVAQYQFLADKDDLNWHADIAVEFQQNWKRSDLGAYFFPNGTNTITVGQDSVAGVDVRNVDIGLSDTFFGTLTINPRIRNIIAEPQLYVGLDRWLEGAWFYMKVPITQTRWALDCCETDSAQGGVNFQTAMAPAANLPVKAPAFGTENQIQQAFGGSLTWGNKTSPLGASRIICCEAIKTGVADFPVFLGYNFLNKEEGYIGLYLKGVFPTGNFKNRKSIFDPRVGYNRWQFGAGLNAGIRIYERDEDTSVHGMIDVSATHIFKKTECRVFDLTANGCFSRYLLMFQTDSNGLYTGKLSNFVDAFNACVESKFNWNVDALAYLEFRHKGWTVDLGYEFKGRAKEKFDNCATLSLCDPCNEDACGTDCCTIAATAIGTKQYGIKGLLSVPNVGAAVTTASNSTINHAAAADATAVLINATNFASQLDLAGTAIPQAISHKVWGGFGYSWNDRDYPLYLNLTAEGEFGNSNKALHIWGLFAKAGVAYN